MDTSSDVIVTPLDAISLAVAQVEVPRAASGIRIHRYGHRFLIFDPGLNSKIRWVLVVTEVLIWHRLSRYFHLIVNAWHRKIVDRRTLLTVTGPCATVVHATTQCAETPA